MPGKNLPAYLKQVLEHHVSNAQLTHDSELQGIYERLTNLNTKVELAKEKIRQNRLAKDPLTKI
ncbi:hypothetical protein [Paraglaciecola sp. T6c]|uniref:hypothetical protein n=1 Tax=Pseudoalteromonas atlantica (strain T6c / ATCC BAA-1087) TaxID=3042615 RepID=UPI0002E5EDEE|nr:hypothetical protein [Paraglaciecola sp. T6c]